MAFYTMKPKPGVRTNKAGWMKDTSNLQYDEKVEITRGLKNSSATAKIIINLSNKTVERNGFNDNKDFKGLFKYFFAGYHNYITAVMKQLDQSYLESVLDELEAEMQADQAQNKAETVE